MFERVFAGHTQELVRRVVSGKHLTRVHGDAHVQNFFFPRDDGTGKTKIIDWYTPDWVWQCWAGVSYLAYMVVRFWYPERRRWLEQSLLERYFAKLQAHGVSEYNYDDLWHDYRLAAILSLYVAIEEAVRVEAWKWYPQLEKAIRAFEDLKCLELLEG